MTAATIPLVPIVIGPEGRGRGYAVLASGGAVAPGSWSVDLPMLLLEWAKLGAEEPFAACLPLDGDAVVVCRGRYFRQLEIGPVAYLHAVHLDAAQLEAIGWQTEAVLEAIPVPAAEDTAFAQMELSVTTDPQTQRGADPLGATWADSYVAADLRYALDDLLIWGLRGIAPAHLRRRVLGWSTSAALPPRGSLNPRRQCQLFVARGQPPGDYADLRQAQAGPDGKVVGERIKDPPAYLAWEAFHRLGSLDGALAGTGWRADYSSDTATEMTARLARIAASHLSASAMLALLRELLASEDADQNAAARQVLPRYLELAGSNSEVAEPLAAFLETARPNEREFVPQFVAALAAKPLPNLDPPLLARVLPACSELAGSGAGPDVLEDVAKIAVHAAQVTERGNKVIDMLVRLLETWPLESRNMLDELAEPRFLAVLAEHGGRPMVEQATQGLLAKPRELLDRASLNRDSSVRALRALLGAYYRLKASHG